MIPQGIDASQGPPYRVPLGFFSVAGIFFVAAGLLMTGWNELLWIHRKSYSVYGILHASTIGVFAFTMFGALFQMLPVIAGSVVKVKETSVRIVRMMFAAGAVVFIISLLLASADNGDNLLPDPQILIAVSGIFTAFSALHFAVIFIKSLLSRVRGSGGPSAKAFLFSLYSFVTGLIFAGLLALSHGGAAFLLPVHQGLADSHAALMLFGWAGILITGVSFQIMPMFFTAAEYPGFLKKNLSMLMFGSVILHTVLLNLPSSVSSDIPLSLFAESLLFILYLVYVVYTFSILSRRKRRVADRSLFLFYTALVSLILSLFLFGAARLTAVHAVSGDNGTALSPFFEIAAGVFFLYGFLLGMMNGMILKIVPFLSWFHLISSGKMVMTPMSGFLHERSADLLPWWHLLTLVTLVLAAVTGLLFPDYLPFVSAAGGLLYTGNGILFLWIVLFGIKKYREAL